MPSNKPRVYLTLEWKETLDLLGDQEAMSAIRQSLAEIRRGDKGKPWRDIYK